VSQKVLKDVLKKIIPNLDETRSTSSAPWDWLGMSWGPDAKTYQ